MVALTQEQRPDKVKVDTLAKPEQLGDLRAWSYSALKVFEDCPYRSYIQKVKKIREPSNPAADRGTEIHQQAEDYVNGTIGEMPDTLHKFKDEFEELRELYADAKVELEGEWGFDLDWQPVGWVEKATWARIKLDALVNEDEQSARVIDYKTGKAFGNEIAHSQQALVYAIGSFFRYPELQIAKTEIWYLDHGTMLEQVYTRDEAMVFMPKLHDRAIAMTTATKFPPNPSTYNCKWCSYGKGEHPICEWGNP